jgi:hypothetical protein
MGEPAETLFELAPQQDVPLVMPRLGQPVEPAHAGKLKPWWRAVEGQMRQVEAPVERAWARLPKRLPWPFD